MCVYYYVIIDRLHSLPANLQTCAPPLPQTTNNNFFLAELKLKFWTKENRETSGSAKAISVTSGWTPLEHILSVHILVLTNVWRRPFENILPSYFPTETQSGRQWEPFNSISVATNKKSPLVNTDSRSVEILTPTCQTEMFHESMGLI